MDRRTFISGVTGTLLAAPLVSHAQQQGGTVYRIGFISGFSAAGAAPVRSILVDALRNLGYREGQNATFHERYADGKFDRLAALAAELVQLRVNVITTQTTPAALAAKRATSTIPIVNVTSGDAVGSGLVASLAHPGSNVTGLSFLGTELAVKQMELVKEVVPAAALLGLLANRGIRPEVNFFGRMERAAGNLGVRVMFVEARTSGDYPAAFAAITQAQVDALVVAPSILNHDEWHQVVHLAARSRLPVVYPYREFPDVGGLMSYGFNRREFFGRAAQYVDKILKGAAPADLPIEQPTRFELIINLKTAKALGLTIPPSLLQRADQVIE